MAVALLAAPAAAQLRDYCPDRPGLDTPACTTDRGHVSVETAVVDWTRDVAAGARTDTVLIGDTLVRLGVADSVEARVGWTPYGHQRVRERGSGVTDQGGGVGDVTIGLKSRLVHSTDLSISVLPRVSLPVGREPIGAGNLGAALLLPSSYRLARTVRLEATPEVDAAVNMDGPGRHLAYSMTGGVAWRVVKPLSLTGELQVRRDDDPHGSRTPALAAVSIAVLAGRNLQFDVLGAGGLNRDAPGLELYGGVSRRF